MKPPVGERWGESRMSNFVSVIIGGFAAVCAWFGIEFLGKPFRTFFELKKDIIRGCIVLCVVLVILQ